MKLIPVLDIKDGIVVHAKRGMRDQYLPLQPNADVFAVIDHFLNLYDFDTLYIADLNAIMGLGDNQALIARVLTHYSHIEFWLDCGRIQPFAADNYLPVLGSEWCSVQDLTRSARFILSLDFSAHDQPLGDTRLFSDSTLWSKQVIIMTLARVGSDTGVALNTLQYYRQHYPNTDFIAAGGVRNLQDVQDLQAIGIQQVLLASALHNGTLQAKDLSLECHALRDTPLD